MIRLSIKDYFRWIRVQPFAFAVLFIGIFMASYAMFFMVGMAYKDYVEETSFTGNPTKLLEIELEDDSVNNEILQMVTQLKEEKKLMPKIEKIALFSHSENSMIGLDSVSEKEPVESINYGTFFTEEQLEEEQRVILLSEQFLNKLPIDQYEKTVTSSTTIDNTSYLTTGTFRVYENREESELIIPLSIFLQDGYTAETMKIYLHKKPSKGQLKYLEQYLSQYSFIKQIKLPPLYDNMAITDFISNIFSVFLIFACSLFSVLTTLLFWMDQNFKKYFAYMLCGASNLSIKKIILINVNGLTITALLFARIFYVVMEKNFITYAITSHYPFLYSLIPAILFLIFISISTYCISILFTKNLTKFRRL